MYFFSFLFLFSYDSWSSIGKEKVPTYKIYVCIAYCLWGSFIHVQGGEIMSKCYFKTESIGKLSNFNFQWTKPLYQNDFNNTAFFFTLFKGHKIENILFGVIYYIYSPWKV